MTTAALTAELRRRQSQLPKLEKRAAAVRATLAALEAKIAALGGPDAPLRASTPPQAARAGLRSQSGGRKVTNSTVIRRRHGQPTIGERAVEVLNAAAGALGPHEIATAVGKVLSREVTPNFLVQISLTLARLVKRGSIVKLGRGQYAAQVGATGGAGAGTV